MPNYDLDDLKRRMESAINVLRKEFSGIRAGRANINLLEPVSVSTYGQKMKLRDLSTVSAPEARLITIQVWDASNVSVAEKAIHDSGLGLNPQTEGQIIRIVLPKLLFNKSCVFERISQISTLFQQFLLYKMLHHQQMILVLIYKILLNYIYVYSLIVYR